MNDKEWILIHSLARSLQARLFMQFLCACTELSVLAALRTTDVLLAHQEKYTAIDWIVATRRAVQLRLPEHCESRRANP